MKAAARLVTGLAAVASGGLLLAAPFECKAAGAESDRLFDLPAVGSYELPVIDRVSPHVLVDDRGRSAALLDLAPGKCAVVSFVYASCPDATGCPAMLATLRRIDHTLARRPDVASRVELVTVSFDPESDTPEVLAMLRRHLDPKGDWRFLTAGSEAELRPVLDDYGQDALRLVSAEDGEPLRLIRHVAKVFLVDADRGIRNIYSTGFLDDRILLRDIETLLAEGAD